VDTFQLVKRLATAVVRRRKRLALSIFVGVCLVLVPVGYLVSKEPPRFQTSATLLLEARDSRMPLFQELSPLRPLPVQLEILRSRSLAESVVENLPNAALKDLLEVRYGQPYSSKIENAFRRVTGAELRIESPQRRILGELQGGRVSFLTKGDHGIVEIWAEASQPQVAVDIVNGYIEALLARTRSFNIEDARVSREFLEQQLADIKKTLQGSEDELRSFNTSHGGVRIPDQSQTAVSHLSEAETALAEVAANRKMLDIRLRALREKIETQKGLPPPPAPALFPAARPAAVPDNVQRLRAQLAQLETTLLDLRTKYTDEHPRIVLVRDRIGEVQRHLGEAVKETTMVAPAPGAVPQRERVNFAEQVLLLETATHTLAAQEEALQRQVAMLRRSLTGLSQSELQYSRIVRDVDSNRSLQKLLADRLVASRIREQGEMKNVKVIDPAGFPVPAANPNRVLLLLAALLLAALSALAIPGALEWLHRTVESEDDVEAITGFPVLGAIPRLRGRRPMYGSAFATLSRERPGQDFMYTEAIRGLRVAVQLAARAEGLRTILVASALENEGKSTVVFNLGLAFREAGKRVGLADTDFERPTLHLASKTQPTEGLAEAMHAQLDPHTLASLGDGIWLAPRGQAFRAQTRGIMASNRLKELMGELAEHADIVICDSSPLLLVPEALFLACAVDAVILVVKSGSTKAHELTRVKAMLEGVGARVIGAVLNEVPPSTVDGYYKRYYKAYVKRSAS